MNHVTSLKPLHGFSGWIKSSNLLQGSSNLASVYRLCPDHLLHWQHFDRTLTMSPGLLWALCLLYYFQYHNNQSYFVIHFLQMRKLKYRQIQQLVQNLIASRLGKLDLNPCRQTPSSMPLTPLFYGPLIFLSLVCSQITMVPSTWQELKIFLLNGCW